MRCTIPWQFVPHCVFHVSTSLLVGFARVKTQSVGVIMGLLGDHSGHWSILNTSHHPTLGSGKKHLNAASLEHQLGGKKKRVNISKVLLHDAMGDKHTGLKRFSV
jgi:hypothetical protein